MSEVDKVDKDRSEHRVHLANLAHLSPRTVLQRSPDLRIDIASSTNVTVSIHGRRHRCGPHALAILDAFAQPQTLSDVTDTIGPRMAGVQEWMDCLSTIARLHEVGVLVDAREVAAGWSANDWDSASFHAAMLNDKIRTTSLLSGMAAVVRPGDVVVDIGTGTGILAIAAAKAGAAHVYAIEATDVGRVAQAMFEQNGMADRITLLRGWSTSLTLPRPADVLVSEVIGNDPLGEHVLEIVLDARKRLLSPDPRFVPSRIRVYAEPVMFGLRERQWHTFSAEALKRWGEWYGVDFTTLRGAATAGMPLVHFTRPQSLKSRTPMADAVLVADLDLGAVTSTAIENSVSVTATMDGSVDAVIVWFELKIAPGIVLSTHPESAAETNHWKIPVWIVDEPFTVRPGDRMTVSYAYRADGMGTRAAVSRG